MELSRERIQAIADENYDNAVYDVPEHRVFSLLVDVASHLYQSYTEIDHVSDIEDPDAFKTSMLGGVNHGWGMIQGLIENLEMNFPDAEFRRML